MEGETDLAAVAAAGVFGALGAGPTRVVRGGGGILDGSTMISTFIGLRRRPFAESAFRFRSAEMAVRGERARTGLLDGSGPCDEDEREHSVADESESDGERSERASRRR